MKTLSGFCAALLCFLPAASRAQVNSGSNGSDGALNPTANLVIDMADHPDGIFHYTSVNIPAGVTVCFIPNAGNKPVVWLVQEDCVIGGNINLDGKNGQSPEQGSVGGEGGPGGYQGGSEGTRGLGPGGGEVGQDATYATLAYSQFGGYGGNVGNVIYGNQFILPLI